MSAFRFFLSYPTGQTDFNPTTYSEYVEITQDVHIKSIGNLSQNLSSNEYAIGSIKFNKISVLLRNDHSRYSEVENPLSIFTFKRDETKIKIEWDRNHNPAICGSAPCGLTFLSVPILVYEGLLEDNSSVFDAGAQTQKFTFLGLESLLKKDLVPMAYIDVFDTVQENIKNILLHTRINDYVTVDTANINVNYDFLLNTIDPLEDKTALEALDELLFLSGSVLYIRDTIVHVSNRAASDDSVFTFYGPSSDLGIENLHSLSAFTLGINRTFNFWKWSNTSIKVKFDDSIEKYGLRKHDEIDSELVTDPVVQNAILISLINEFGFPKKEIEISVPLTSPIVNDIFLLDKINIDYPADYRGGDDPDDVAARYQQAKYGSARYIQAVSSVLINVTTNWKILNRSLSVKSDKITYKIREA